MILFTGFPLFWRYSLQTSLLVLSNTTVFLTHDFLYLADRLATPRQVACVCHSAAIASRSWNVLTLPATRTRTMHCWQFRISRAVISSQEKFGNGARAISSSVPLRPILYRALRRSAHNCHGPRTSALPAVPAASH
jgi:hypothetical protein